ncbi:MAG: hypothetical protein WC683_16120 [bacterium]
MTQSNDIALPPMSREAKRMLVVAYDLADGSTEKPFTTEALDARCDALGVYTMTDEQFGAYALGVKERVAALRKASLS